MLNKPVVIWRGSDLVIATRKYFQEAGCFDGTIHKGTNVNILSKYIFRHVTFMSTTPQLNCLKIINMVIF